MTAGWCGCGRGHPSKICPGCERCLCDHPEYDRPALWREAPPALRVAGFEKLFVAHEALREEEDGMPGRQGEGSGRSGRGDLPRTDLPPRKLP